MADQFIAFDPEADEGERLSPEVRTEIAFVAPSAVLNGSITTAKLADDAVNQDKIAPGAVGSVEIATGGVAAENMGAESVTTTALAADAVTPVKCGTGVVTAADASGNDLETREVYLTAVQYAAISSPDPNTTYYIS